MDGPRVKILVPKGVVISYRHSSPHGSDVKLRNVESEVEISTVHNSIRLDNVSGDIEALADITNVLVRIDLDRAVRIAVTIRAPESST